MSLQILTANHLGEGDVVFLGEGNVWVRDLNQARVAADPDAASVLEGIGAAEVARNVVVEPYLIEIEEIEGAPVPTRNRERIRAQGPTVHPDFQR